MRKLILYIAASLDGYIARRNDDLDWLPQPDEAGYNEFIKGIDVILMGRKTYDVCKKFDPWPYTQRCIVFTRHPQKYHHENVVFTDENPLDVLAKLRKEHGKDIWLEGGSELIKVFHERRLIDEYVIAIIPVTIGDGIPLFVKSDATVKLQLSAIKEYKDFLEVRYTRGDS
jgi:dihydrofolate reductase